MSDEPVRLTLVREGEMIAIDLATTDPIVPRSLVPVSADLLRDIDKELARLSTTAARWTGTVWSPQSPTSPPNALLLDQLKTKGCSKICFISRSLLGYHKQNFSLFCTLISVSSTSPKRAFALC